MTKEDILMAKIDIQMGLNTEQAIKDRIDAAIEAEAERIRIESARHQLMNQLKNEITDLTKNAGSYSDAANGVQLIATAKLKSGNFEEVKESIAFFKHYKEFMIAHKDNGAVDKHTWGELFTCSNIA